MTKKKKKGLPGAQVHIYDHLNYHGSSLPTEIMEYISDGGAFMNCCSYCLPHLC
jgi:hypothetical protein